MVDRFHDENLIFLISQQRAGSTLLQRILGGHPDIHTTAEPWLMLHPIYALKEEGHQAEYNETLAYKALQDYLRTLEEGDTHYIEALRRMTLYLYETACKQAKRPYFLDKTPRYTYIIPELLRVFPQAHFIILLRNPLAVLASILNTWVKEHWILLARYRQDLLDAPRSLLDGIEMLGHQAIVVHYEELVSNPALQVKVICQQLNLPFSPDMLEYGRVSKPKGSMGDRTKIEKRTRPTKESLEQWLDLGRVAQTRHFAECYLRELGPDIVRKFGYDYTELETKLMAVSCQQGKLSFTWQQLMQPDSKLQERLYFVELALLEHRRLVHKMKQWRKSLVGR